MAVAHKAAKGETKPITVLLTGERSIIKKLTMTHMTQKKPAIRRTFSKTLKRKLVRDICKGPRAAEMQRNDLAKSGIVASERTLSKTLHRSPDKEKLHFCRRNAFKPEQRTLRLEGL